MKPSKAIWSAITIEGRQNHRNDAISEANLANNPLPTTFWLHCNKISRPGKERGSTYDGHVQDAYNRWITQKIFSTSLVTSSDKQAGPTTSFHYNRETVMSSSLKRFYARWESTANEWNKIVLSNDLRFNLHSEDISACVWKICNERLNTAFAL